MVPLTVSAAVVPVEAVSVQPLVELAITETRAQAGFVYRFDRENLKASLLVSLGHTHFPVPAPVDLDSRAVSIHWDRQTPIAMHQNAAADWRFAALPEFRNGKFEGVVSIPLIDNAAVVGMANFCIRNSEPWNPRDVCFLMSLSLPLGAVVSAAALRTELARTSQQLADRKLLDRAKGLLQMRNSCTEEEAYAYLRRVSRQNRIPMREVARWVIEGKAEEQHADA